MVIVDQIDIQTEGLESSMAFTNIERRTLNCFFNLSGYVMDFSSVEFDDFTEESVDVPIVTKYDLSKAKSLAHFFKDANEKEGIKLLADLIEYYETIYSAKMENRQENGDFLQMKKYYQNVLEILNKRKKTESLQIINSIEKKVTRKFDSEFLRNRMQELKHQMETDSAASIGTSKDLLESVMKMILDECEVQYINDNGKSVDIPLLWKKVETVLRLDPKGMNDSKSGKSAKKILSSISQIVLGMNELRNHFGTGHGKNGKFKQLPVRYGNLTASLTITVVGFLVDTMEERIKNKNEEDY